MPHCAARLPIHHPSALLRPTRTSAKFLQFGKPTRQLTTRSKALHCMATGSYSIWLSPKGELHERLQEHINRLAEEYAAPSFRPHVTLVGNAVCTEDVARRTTSELAQHVEPFTLKFEDVFLGKIFHQCVFIRCAKADDVMAAASRARQAFGQDPNAHYMPHLSLLYSDIDDETRSAIAQREEQLLFKSDGLPATSYEADTLSLWYTIGEDKSLKSWVLVDEYPVHRN